MIELRDISLDGCYIFSDERDRRVQLRLPTSDNKNVGSFLHEPLRRRQANATVSAGNYCHFVI